MKSKFQHIWSSNLEHAILAFAMCIHYILYTVYSSFFVIVGNVFKGIPFLNIHREKVNFNKYKNDAKKMMLKNDVQKREYCLIIRLANRSPQLISYYQIVFTQTGLMAFD